MQGQTQWPSQQEQARQAPLIPLTEENILLLDSHIPGTIVYNGVPIKGNRLLVRFESHENITDARLRTVTIENNTIVQSSAVEIPIMQWMTDVVASGVEDPVIFQITRGDKTETYLSAVHTNFLHPTEIVGGGLSDFAVSYRQVISPITISEEGMLTVHEAICALPTDMKNYWACAEGENIRHIFRTRTDTKETTEDGRGIVESAIYTFTTKTMTDVTPEKVQEVIAHTHPIAFCEGTDWLGLGPVLPGGVLIGHTGSFLSKENHIGEEIPWYREYALNLCLFDKHYETITTIKLLVDPTHLPSSVATKHPSLLVIYPKYIRRILMPNGHSEWLLDVGINDRYQAVIRTTEANAPEFCQILTEHVDFSHPDFAPHELNYEIACLMYPQWYQ